MHQSTVDFASNILSGTALTGDMTAGFGMEGSENGNIIERSVADVAFTYSRSSSSVS